MRRLPRVRLLLLRLARLLQRCLPAQLRLAPLALQPLLAEGVADVVEDVEDVEGPLLERLLLPARLERPVQELHLPAWVVEAAGLPRLRRQLRACWARSNWWCTSCVLERSGSKHLSEIEPECCGHK